MEYISHIKNSYIVMLFFDIPVFEGRPFDIMLQH